MPIKATLSDPTIGADVGTQKVMITGSSFDDPLFGIHMNRVKDDSSAVRPHFLSSSPKAATRSG